MQGLKNSQDTILVVGGVHWMSSHHVNVIKNALSRANLHDILVVVKTLGAGFHQTGSDVQSPIMVRKFKIINREIMMLYSMLHVGKSS
jgi:hypothetical protein